MRETLRVFKEHLIELLNFNGRSKTKSKREAEHDGGNVLKRDSLASFFGKGMHTRKEKPRDVGLKTVLGSGVVDHGFFSPKLQYCSSKK